RYRGARPHGRSIARIVSTRGGAGWWGGVGGGSGAGVEELVAERVGHLLDLPVPCAELVQALCHRLGGDPARRRPGQAALVLRGEKVLLRQVQLLGDGAYRALRHQYWSKQL